MTTTATIDYYSGQIVESFPVAGKNNDTQTFRNNFKNIKQALSTASFLIKDLQLSTVKTTGPNNFNNNIIKNAVFQDCSEFVVDNASGSSISGDIVVDYREGSYQKFAVDGGSHNFSVINWPGTESEPLQGSVTIYVTTSTFQNTFVTFPGDYVQQGPNVPPFQVEQGQPMVFDVWNDGRQTFVKPLSNYKKVIAEDTISAANINVTDTLQIKNNFYTVGSDNSTVVYNTVSNGIGNLAVIPNQVLSTVTDTGGSLTDPDTVIIISSNANLVKVGASVVTISSSTLNTTSNVVTAINGNQITVTPGFAQPLFSPSETNKTVLFSNPKFAGQPDILRLTTKVPSGTLSAAGDVAGEVYATTSSVYLTFADYSLNTVNKVQLATAADVSSGVASALPLGVITLWYGAVNSVPTDWGLCDGSTYNTGTIRQIISPDLRDKFVIGAGGIYAVNTTGGTSTSIVVDHTHDIVDPGHYHNIQHYTASDNTGANLAGGSGSSTETWQTDSSATNITIVNTGTSGINANLPPYYALCYIIKL